VRILLISAHGADPEFGGAERYVGELAAGLSGRGHQVEILSAFPQRGAPVVPTAVLHLTDWRESEARRIRNHVGDLVSAPWPRVAEFLRELRPDLVHTNNLSGIGTGVWEAARREGIPAVHSLHDHYLLCPRTTLTRRDGSPCTPSPFLCGARTRRLARWHSGVGSLVCPSEYILRAHRHLFPGTPAQVVRPPQESFGGSRSLPASPPQALGYVGALLGIKGIELLLGAARSLMREGVTLRIAGDGPLRPEVEAVEGVEYVGRLSRGELDGFIASCDVGLVPSLCNEASGPPYVVREWLAAGRPVLATRRGGLAEAIEEGGMTAFDGSAAGLLAAVRRIREVNEWRELLSTVPEVPDDRDVQRWLDAHEAAYHAALAPDHASVPA